jgi:PEP-CTERM motif
MFCFKRYLSIFTLPVLLLMAHGDMRAAPATVLTSVALDGSNYLYDFAITNESSADPYYNLISVDFSLPPGTVVGMATAPAGNGASTDPSGAFVEFTSNNVSGFPLGTTVDGFQFVSATQFNSFPFTANYLDSTGLIITPVNGTTSPQAPAVPEPSTLGLLASASLLLLGRRRLLRAR